MIDLNQFIADKETAYSKDKQDLECQIKLLNEVRLMHMYTCMYMYIRWSFYNKGCSFQFLSFVSLCLISYFEVVHLELLRVTLGNYTCIYH